MRDDFNKNVKDQLAKRVGFRCSNPKCKCSTIGPKSGEESNTTGVAAHITAASPGGPRYDSTLGETERKSIHNGIWLCQSCAKLIDNDKNIYTIMRLIMWKNCAEKNQFIEHTQTEPSTILQYKHIEKTIELFRLLKKIQKLYDYFYGQYETTFKELPHIDAIIDYVDRFPQMYNDSIKNELEQLKETGTQGEEMLLECELYIDKGIVDLYNEYFSLGNFKYQHDFVGFYNDYLARFFENVYEEQQKRLNIIEKIEVKMRANI